MEKSSQFMVVTIAVDLLLLLLIGLVPLPGDRVLQVAVALFLVSPLVTYLVVYRDDYRRPFG